MRLKDGLVFAGEFSVVPEAGLDLPGEVGQIVMPGKVEGLLSMGPSKGVLAELGIDAG